jgi:hypothetical protein
VLGWPHQRLTLEVAAISARVLHAGDGKSACALLQPPILSQLPVADLPIVNAPQSRSASKQRRIVRDVLDDHSQSTKAE